MGFKIILMKKLLMILLLLVNLLPVLAQIPNANELFRQKKTQRRYLLQQIAALKAYGKVLKKGYEIAQIGLTTISNIKKGSFDLDKDYLNALMLVKPIIRDSPQVKEILLVSNEITRGLGSLYLECPKDENFTQNETKYIEAVYKNMLRETGSSLTELALVITSGETEMKDDERLLRLDRLHKDVLNKYAFTQTFIISTRQLAVQRAKEKNQISISGNLTTEP